MRDFVFIIFLFSWACQRPSDHPNVLMIAIDDLNDYVGCMDGAISAHTPNIDRLASEGVLFTNAHCQAPICGPSRASLMTGLYPSTSGNYLQLKDADIRKGSPAVQESRFIPDYFEECGYDTWGVGKIFHQGDAAQVFDEYGGRFDWFGPKPSDRMNYDPATWPGKSGNTQTDWGAFPAHDSMMPDFRSASWASQKLAHRQEKPWFMAVGFLRPHVPWHVPQKWFDSFPLEEIVLPPYLPDDLADVPPLGVQVSDVPMMPTTEELIEHNQWRQALQAYLASIAFVDHQIGRLLDALEQSIYANNTLVVLWSDHGYHLGEKNRFAKMSLWERDSRTVLIFRDPQLSGGQRISTPVELIDIYPTLLERCNLPAYNALEGHSLLSLYRGENLSWDHRALTMYGPGNVAVRGDRYRYIQYADGSGELYDMERDPNEWHNLIDQSEFAEVITDLKAEIPQDMVPLSPFSTYAINPYFRSLSQ